MKDKKEKEQPKACDAEALEPEVVQDVVQEPTELEKLESELAAKDEQIKLLKEQAARATADFYNFRTRVERDRERDMKFAAERAVNGLLPVYENLERVVASISDKEDSVAKGIAMVTKQFMEVLESLGLEEISTEGKFDPAEHEAVMLEAVEDEARDGDIIAVFRKGYRLAGRVLRAAQVRVAKFEKQ